MEIQKDSEMMRRFPVIAEYAIAHRWLRYGMEEALEEDGTAWLYMSCDQAAHRMPSKPEDVTEERFRRIFSWKLMQIMKFRGISQIELAEITGLSKQTLSNYICCRQNASAYAVAKIAHALQCNTEDLMYMGWR